MPCTTILAGKKATNDGSTLIARNSDGSFKGKRVLVVTPEKQPRIYKTVGSHLSIELPDDPVRYTISPNIEKNYKGHGIWPAHGINAFNVAMTATETVTSNPRVMGADPYVELREKDGKRPEVPGGIGEEDFLTIVLPYIKSAREGVLRLGSLLEKYGTYEPNGIAFSDKDEVWWLETIGGHHWIAKRVPDDRVVIMPNQFGLDNFDFSDAYGKGKDNLCSPDLKEFTEKYHLYKGWDMNGFNPRLAFGSRRDADHIYNTPRSWFMARYLLERTYKWDGPDADFTPESNDIPWSFVPEKKITVEDVRYLLGSHYQGTPYDPYDERSPLKGKYRVIGVPNSDTCAILQIRGYMPAELQGLQWVMLGGSGFTACFPVYANVGWMPEYISGTTDVVSTDSLYWQSRLFAALVDSNYKYSVIYAERYQNTVMENAERMLHEYDEKFMAETERGEDAQGEARGKKDSKAGSCSAPLKAEKLLEEANAEMTKMVKNESDKALNAALREASEHMKTRYHRGDN